MRGGVSAMTAMAIQVNLHSATSEPGRVVEYRAGGTMFNALPIYLILFAVALAMVIFGARSSEGRLAAWILLVLLPLGLALGLWRSRTSGPPYLILTPQGLELRTGGWGVLALPWAAIRAIETRSFEGFALRYRGRQRIAFKDVTMIELAPGVLAAERDAGRFVPRGPSVDWVVRPGEDSDWIALHHEFVGLTPAEIRGPVEARWQAFRDNPAPADTCPLPPLRLGGFRPRHPSLFNLGTAAGAFAIVILLANLAGLWETRSQAGARAWAERWAADEAASRAEAEERRARKEEFDRMFDQPIFGR
ncbi:MAG: hypothetical protein KUA43_12840 [Hoeflea sp.]|uniref:hypothetical protein n=1 Tax=Hoeflea sp. TaxID=1940281 RepID=UPI001DD549B1|nr:hypothetical protein [Hoeflea sp.]MBU4527900.1 hypothetical protein [Alphaproteobacteria bacterium]MBU4546065.1 hypothetical protein [Alphaproteobacteria bacterium]MBU4553250.1 hypothetical protein [Alphaproteobacteria bacterium]MBV1724322.1 hypothetical protein [Hoeflea sp.]MBV1763318.1 hypothetical protein [Hoeflea sp.]